MITDISKPPSIGLRSEAYFYPKCPCPRGLFVVHADPITHDAGPRRAAPRSVRVRDGKKLVTDGPFAATKKAID
jgi:hypothetical protein